MFGNAFSGQRAESVASTAAAVLAGGFVISATLSSDASKVVTACSDRAEPQLKARRAGAACQVWHAIQSPNQQESQWSVSMDHLQSAMGYYG